MKAKFKDISYMAFLTIPFIYLSMVLTVNNSNALWLNGLFKVSTQAHISNSGMWRSPLIVAAAGMLKQCKDIRVC